MLPNRLVEGAAPRPPVHHQHGAHGHFASRRGQPRLLERASHAHPEARRLAQHASSPASGAQVQNSSRGRICRRGCRARTCRDSRARRGTRGTPGGRVLDLEAGEHAAEVGAVVAVVEQADVPAAAQLLEELRQRAGPLGELEPAQPLVAHVGRAAADHVAHVQLGHLVVGEVDGLVAGGDQLRRQRRAVLARLRRDADEDVRLLAGRSAGS